MPVATCTAETGSLWAGAFIDDPFFHHTRRTADRSCARVAHASPRVQLFRSRSAVAVHVARKVLDEPARLAHVRSRSVRLLSGGRGSGGLRDCTDMVGTFG